MAPSQVKPSTKTTDGEPRLPFPSPSTSNTINKEAQQPSPSPPEAEADIASQYPQESGADQELERKRKRPQDPRDLTLEDQDNLISKRTRIASADGSNREQEEVRSTNSANDPSIEHWRKTGYWPPKCLDFNSAMSRPLNNKRSFSSLSYTQSGREGLNPAQYTPGYEEVLQDAGIYMNEEWRQTISDKSQELCEVLLNSFFPPPSNFLFGDQSFLLTVDEVGNENEARVQRDITPLLVPCASLLYIHDRVLQCRHLSAKIQSEWTKVTSLAGPRPTPDYVVGLKPSAFTGEEILRLQIYSAPKKATIFRDGLYFPFLICEVKRGENGLRTAERQSMHAASVAANAIVELFRDRAVSRVKELDRVILVFSISHNHMEVKIHGHYARIEGDKTTLHRYRIRSLDILDQNSKEKWTTYHFVRKIYDYFAPIHLERIRGAVAKLPVSSAFGISSASLESNPGLDTETESNSQEMAEGTPSSKDTERSKKPRLRPAAMYEQEIDYLKEQVAQSRELARMSQSMLQRLIEENNRQKQEAEERSERQISKLLEALPKQSGKK